MWQVIPRLPLAEKKHMVKYMANVIVNSNLNEHPVVQAWRKLKPKHDDPARITALKKQKRKSKSSVYRLEGITKEDTNVIAKRCRRGTALLESIIYEKILSQLPVTSLKYYGYVEENEQFCWLFIEDSAGVPYKPSSEDHQTLVTQWLARLHTSASHVAAAAQLPDRGTNYYIGHLRYARDEIKQNLFNPMLNINDIEVLESILLLLDVVECHWSQVEKCCERLPLTLVHGDFQPKNVHVRNGQVGIVLFPMDWEHAGWAVPAVDLSSFDINAYWLTVRDYWPTLDFKDIQRLQHIGKIFRYIVCVSWAASGVASELGEWVEKTTKDMRKFESWLKEAIEEIGWQA